jgi:hypothetical protein
VSIRVAIVSCGKRLYELQRVPRQRSKRQPSHSNYARSFVRLWCDMDADKVSESFKLNQGTVLAVSPLDGAVYPGLATIRFDKCPRRNHHHQINRWWQNIYQRYVYCDDSNHLIRAAPPFHSVRTRTPQWPSMAVGVCTWRGRSAALDQVVTRGLWLQCLAMVPTGPSPALSIHRQPVDIKSCRLLTAAAGKLMLIFYDLREDHTIGIFTP